MSLSRRHVLTAAAVPVLSPAVPAWAQPLPDDQTGLRLREAALQAQPKDLNLTPSPEMPQVFGVVMDMPVDEKVASTVAMGDGSTSLYSNTEFAILGGGAHESVRAAGRRLITAAQAFWEQAETIDATPLPPPGQVLYFYLLGFEGRRRLKVDLAELQAGTSPHRPLFIAALDTMMQLRKSVGL